MPASTSFVWMVAWTFSRNFLWMGAFSLISFATQRTLRLEIAKRQVLEFTADHAHFPGGVDGRVNVQGFCARSSAAVRIEVFERAHVVERSGQLDEHDADVMHHGMSICGGFRLTRFRRHDVRRPLS